MGNDSSPIKLTPSAATAIGSTLLYAICVNKTLTGTLTITDGATTLGQMAIGTTPNVYHSVPLGGRYSNLTITLSAADDVTVYLRKV